MDAHAPEHRQQRGIRRCFAMEVGYANVKTFNRNFLRFKVMTPGDFRKKVALQESRL